MPLLVRGTRFLYVQTLAMELRMASRMQENPVGCMMCASFALPDDVMVVPSGDLGDLLLTHRTYPVLLFPEMPQLPSSREVLCHFDAKAFFKVHFPGRIKRVCFSLDRGMPLDFHIRGSSQMDQLLVPFFLFNFSGEHPVHRANCREIFLFHPGGAFVWVSPPGPPPQLFEDRVVHGVEGFATCAEAMIGRPSSYDGVQLHNQLSGRAIPVFLDGSSNLLQECANILLRGGRQNFPVWVLAYMQSKEIEAVLDMRDHCFLLREA